MCSQRAVNRRWRDGPQGSPAVTGRTSDALEDPDLGLGPVGGVRESSVLEPACCPCALPGHGSRALPPRVHRSVEVGFWGKFSRCAYGSFYRASTYQSSSPSLLLFARPTLCFPKGWALSLHLGHTRQELSLSAPFAGPSTYSQIQAAGPEPAGRPPGFGLRCHLPSSVWRSCGSGCRVSSLTATIRAALSLSPTEVLGGDGLPPSASPHESPAVPARLRGCDQGS